jgi:TonB family protein
MSPEPKKVYGEISEERLGSLSGCLVDGDAEQRSGERSVRRQSLAISIVVQTAVVTALIFVSLFGKPQTIALANVTPLPPFGHRANHAAANTQPRLTRPPNSGDYTLFPTPSTRPVARPGEGLNPVGPPDLDPGPNQPTDGPDCGWCVDIGGKSKGPRPPDTSAETHLNPRIIHVTTLDPAMLIRRVEPAYPALARQTHREGRVELRAIIGIDGTIQSLQIVASDPLFDLSAREAVQQWHYKPTILNGQPVEIDTYITVIYTMQH